MKFAWGAVFFFGASLVWAPGCATPAQAQSANAPTANAQSGNGAADNDAGGTPGAESGQGPSAGAGPQQGEAGELSSGPLDDRLPDPSRALPEVTARHIGMHIGGESNSAESKKPWLSDLESHNRRYLVCYRLVGEPLKGGTFGVDLFVGRGGGAPEVRGIRQKMGGEDFEKCMSSAFAELNFHRPERPTVFSYSLRFDVSGAASSGS